MSGLSLHAEDWDAFVAQAVAASSKLKDRRRLSAMATAQGRATILSGISGIS